MKTCARCGREYDQSTVFCSGDGYLLDAFDVDELCNTVLDARYRLEEKLGEGAHGVVFRATQLGIDRTVAIKVLHPSKVLHPTLLPDLHDVRDYWLSCVVRFQREAKAASRFHHPNIVAVTDFGHTSDDIVYMVMEHLAGASLRKIIKANAPLALPFVQRVMRQVCWAVEAAHREGIIHRDLKPSNIVVETVEGLGEVVKVLDFGIAKLTSHADSDLTNLTDTGVFLGTPKYMSPEQCSGMELDARSDVYSLGIVLYEMLTSVLPFRGTAMAVALQHTTTQPRSLRELVPGLPESIERVVLTALAKHPDDRYPSAVALLEALDRAINETISTAEGTSGFWTTSSESLRSFSSAEAVRPLQPVGRSRIEISIPGDDEETPRGTRNAELDELDAEFDDTPPVPPAAVPSPTGDISTAARRPVPPAPTGMVLVPQGSFRMGSDAGMPNERPVHEVFLDNFFVDATEVTNGQYNAFCQATGHTPPPNPRWDSNYFLGKPDHPVVNVTWTDANEYARWAGKRLPTEAEWEKSARGGLEGKAYPWGDEITPDLANYESTGTRSVGSFPANGYGIHEISGNVWEWCADWYQEDAYVHHPRVSPKGPNDGIEKVLRGGSLDGTISTLRISYRHWMSPSHRSSDIGFRCVMDIP